MSYERETRNPYQHSPIPCEDTASYACSRSYSSPLAGGILPVGSRTDIRNSCWRRIGVIALAWVTAGSNTFTISASTRVLPFGIEVVLKWRRRSPSYRHSRSGITSAVVSVQRGGGLCLQWRTTGASSHPQGVCVSSLLEVGAGHRHSRQGCAPVPLVSCRCERVRPQQRRWWWKASGRLLLVGQDRCMRVGVFAFGTRLCSSYARGLGGGGAGLPLLLRQCGHRPFTTLLYIFTSRCCSAHWVYDRHS